MNGATNFIDWVREQGKYHNSPGLKVAKVIEIEPLEIELDSLKIKKNLFISPNLRIKEKDEITDIFEEKITLEKIDKPYVYKIVEHNGETQDTLEADFKGELRDFLQEFFESFVIDIDDLVAVQQTGEDFIILSKLERVKN